MTAVEAIAPQKERSERNEVGEDDTETLKIPSLRKAPTFSFHNSNFWWFTPGRQKDNRRDCIGRPWRQRFKPLVYIWRQKNNIVNKYSLFCSNM